MGLWFQQLCVASGISSHCWASSEGGSETRTNSSHMLPVINDWQKASATDCHCSVDSVPSQSSFPSSSAMLLNVSWWCDGALNRKIRAALERALGRFWLPDANRQPLLRPVPSCWGWGPKGFQHFCTWIYQRLPVEGVPGVSTVKDKSKLLLKPWTFEEMWA